MLVNQYIQNLHHSRIPQLLDIIENLQKISGKFYFNQQSIIT